MKKLINFTIVLFAVGLLMSCNKVPAGYKGVKVYLLGSSKGVDSEELGVGRYWIGINEDLYLFPTFTQNYVWTKSVTEQSPTDESLTFQTAEGLSVNTDVGISYRVDPTKVTDVFQKYRKGIDEITNIFIRNEVRDALVKASSTKPVEFVYGVGKTKLINEVDSLVKASVKPFGIIVEKVYFVGELRLPKPVLDALNAKITATQKAQQRENELRQAEAEAKKLIAIAQGEAEANRLLVSSLTSQLIQWEELKIKHKEVEKWKGEYPNTLVNGSGSGTFLNLK